MIQAVLFDYGGVLTTSGKRGFITNAVAELYGVNPRSLDIDEQRKRLYRGQSDEDAFFRSLNRQYGRHVTKGMFLDKVKQSFVPCEEVYALVDRLRSSGIKTGILSNVFAMSAAVLKEHGWYDGFDPIVLSCREGCAKPDLHIYKIALERLGLPAASVLLIDDQESYLLPARILGMHTIQAHSPDQLVADTQTLMLKENGLRL